MSIVTIGITVSLYFLLARTSESFQTPRTAHNYNYSLDKSSIRLAKRSDDKIDLQAELRDYLKRRDELNADEIAKSQVGKVIGGSKGNPVIEFLSVAPKEIVVDAIPDVFDYNELRKYGFGNLCTPIADAGGRIKMYELMSMPIPQTLYAEKPKPARKVVLDRTGEGDKARYSGLKMSQIVDDEEMGNKLAEYNKKMKDGTALKPKLIEEEFLSSLQTMKLNTKKKSTVSESKPEMTPEMLDEEGRKAGRAVAWAKAARAGEYKKDPYEKMNVENDLQVYSILSVLFVSFAFGKSSDKALDLLGFTNDGILSVLHGPALVLFLVSISSCVFCAIFLAPEKNRSPFIWGVKGLAGGVLTVLQLKELDSLNLRRDE